MTGDLLRIPHGNVPTHDLVLRRESRTSFLLAVVSSHQGPEIVLHCVHLKAAELSAVAKVFIDLLAGGSP